jgi:TonB family protein
MIEKNTTTYSIIGSFGIHMFFTLGAGSFLMNINKNIQLPKPYKLEFVKRKEPPPVKKEKIRKEMVRREIKVASLTPKAIPVVKPKTTVRQITKNRALIAMPQTTPRQVQRTVVTRSVVKHSSNPTLSRRVSTPVARSIAPTKNSNIRGSNLVAIVQRTQKFKLSELPKPVVRSGSSSSPKQDKGRLVYLETRTRLASLTSFPSPRAVPNIYDKGALKSYIGKVQRIIEGAKRYPEGARRAGRQGKLKVQFTILKNGDVNNVRLVTETPYPNLNREAMAAVKRAAPFSGFPDSIMKKSLEIILPFRFELN